MRPVLLATLLLVAVATGALAAPPKEARFALDGVEYLYVTGVNRTGTAQVNGQPLAFESCAFLQLHPGTPNGRATVVGVQPSSNFDVPAVMFIDQFRLDSGKRGYSYDKPSTEDGLSRVAEVAVRGNATMRVFADRYWDPVGSTGIDAIDKDQPDMTGQVQVLTQGTRDDVTKEVLSGEPAEDAELHVHIRSHKDAIPNDIVYTFGSPGDPAGQGIPLPMAPTEGYAAQYMMYNTKLGGVADLSMSADAYAPAGMNTLSVTILSPAFEEVANLTLEPALLASDSGTASFPLDQLGYYYIRIGGQVSLATYEGSVTLHAPETLDLHLWYENVTYGYQAYQDYRACLKVAGSSTKIEAVDSVVARPKPPQFNVVWAGLGVFAGVGIVTAGIKLVSDQVSMSAFRKNK